MDVFGEGHSNEVYTKNMISSSLIKTFVNYLYLRD